MVEYLAIAETWTKLYKASRLFTHSVYIRCE